MAIAALDLVSASHDSSDPPCDEQPVLSIDGVLDRIREHLAARKSEAESRAEQICILASQYARAAEHDAASEVAERAGLVVLSERRAPAAARAILDAIAAFPELAEPTPSGDGAPSIEAPAARVARIDESATVTPPDSDPLFHELLREFDAISFDGQPDDIFRASAEEFACRVRELQDRHVRDDLDLGGRIIRRLTAIQRERHAGFVFGLSRSHNDDWRARAERARRARERAIASRSRPERVVAAKIVIPAAVRAQVVADEEVDDESDAGDADQYPRLASLVHDKGLVVVGGIVKREKLARLQRTFGERVEWIATDAAGNNALSALAGRIRSGSVGATIVLDGAVSHKHFEPLIAAARLSRTPLGYGWRLGKASLAEALREIETSLSRTE